MREKYFHPLETFFSNRNSDFFSNTAKMLGFASDNIDNNKYWTHNTKPIKY